MRCSGKKKWKNIDDVNLIHLPFWWPIHCSIELWTNRIRNFRDCCNKISWDPLDNHRPLRCIRWCRHIHLRHHFAGNPSRNCIQSFLHCFHRLRSHFRTDSHTHQYLYILRHLESFQTQKTHMGNWRTRLHCDIDYENPGKGSTSVHTRWHLDNQSPLKHEKSRATHKDTKSHRVRFCTFHRVRCKGLPMNPCIHLCHCMPRDHPQRVLDSQKNKQNHILGSPSWRISQSYCCRVDLKIGIHRHLLEKINRVMKTHFNQIKVFFLFYRWYINLFIVLITEKSWIWSNRTEKKHNQLFEFLTERTKIPTNWTCFSSHQKNIFEKGLYIIVSIDFFQSTAVLFIQFMQSYRLMRPNKFLLKNKTIVTASNRRGFSVREDGGTSDISMCLGQTPIAQVYFASWGKTYPVRRRSRLYGALADRFQSVNCCQWRTLCVSSSKSLSRQTLKTKMVVPKVNSSKSQNIAK